MRVKWGESVRAALMAGVAVSVAVAGPAVVTAKETRPAAAATAAKRYKNIKVLKDLPADQLIPTMRSFTAALGVRCDACHVMTPDRSGFALDTKPNKRIARSMILMVRDLNKRQKVIHGKATCFMCHHGQEQPQTAPLQSPEGDERRPEPPGE